MTSPPIGARIAEALRDACHPLPALRTSVGPMGVGAFSWMVEVPAPVGRLAAPAQGAAAATDVDRMLVELFEVEGRSLVRLARLFVDDRNAAEDLVQEAFIRLARSAHRLKDETKAAAYLRSIVLNLARDHNRRGLVSLRHRLPLDDERAQEEDQLVLRDDQRQIIEALRDLLDEETPSAPPPPPARPASTPQA